ncbi:MAG TPA: RluA family pseudouridine synthase [Terriglobales bacterium]|nr:RluA family pseudouridine synthase [Terriglobales bacterium]
MDTPPSATSLRSFHASSEDAGRRLDQFLTAALENISRARVQELIEQQKVHVNGESAKPSLRLRGGEVIEISGEAERPPLKAVPEDLPLDLVYEDDDLAIINKSAGMMVHAGAGDEERNRGTLVNALLFRFRQLSGIGGEARPGIVHRLDKETSGLIVIAKNDEVHRKLAAQFASRQVKKKYLALVMGWPPEKGTVATAISRDRLRPTRMTTRRSGGRAAVSHWKVSLKLETPYGKFALLEVEIETGRTHQIRVHLASIHHPVVGDSLYGAPRVLRAQAGARGARRGPPREDQLSLNRNFLHAAALEFIHPRTRERMRFERPLPSDLQNFLKRLEFSQA